MPLVGSTLNSLFDTMHLDAPGQNLSIRSLYLFIPYANCLRPPGGIAE